MGEHDMAKKTLPLPRLELNASFVMHPQFILKNLRNNIAVLTFESPVPLGKYPTITNMCIPSKKNYLNFLQPLKIENFLRCHAEWISMLGCRYEEIFQKF